MLSCAGGYNVSGKVSVQKTATGRRERRIVCLREIGAHIIGTHDGLGAAGRQIVGGTLADTFDAAAATVAVLRTPRSGPG